MGFANPIDDPDTYEGMSLQTVRARAEKAAILGAIERQFFDLSAVSEELGITRNRLYRRINQLGIERPPREDD